MSSLLKRILFGELPKSTLGGRLIKPNQFSYKSQCEYGSISERILSYLNSAKAPRPVQEIARTVGYQPSAVTNALWRLSIEGLVIIEKASRHNLYSLSDDGIQFFD